MNYQKRKEQLQKNDKDDDSHTLSDNSISFISDVNQMMSQLEQKLPPQENQILSFFELRQSQNNLPSSENIDKLLLQQDLNHNAQTMNLPNNSLHTVADPTLNVQDSNKQNNVRTMNITNNNSNNNNNITNDHNNEDNNSINNESFFQTSFSQNRNQNNYQQFLQLNDKQVLQDNRINTDNSFSCNNNSTQCLSRLIKPINNEQSIRPNKTSFMNSFMTENIDQNNKQPNEQTKIKTNSFKENENQSFFSQTNTVCDNLPMNGQHVQILSNELPSQGTNTMTNFESNQICQMTVASQNIPNEELKKVDEQNEETNEMQDIMSIQNSQNIKMPAVVTSQQMKETTSKIISLSENFKQQQSFLNNALMLFPQTVNQGDQDYSNSINTIQDQFFKLNSWAYKFNPKLNQFQSLKQSFSRIHTDISLRIKELLFISSDVKEDDLRGLKTEYEDNQQQLKNLKMDLETLIRDYTKDTNIDVVSRLGKFFTRVFGIEQDENHQTDLDKARSKKQEIEKERDTEIAKKAQEFEIFLFDCCDLEQKTQFTKQRVQDLEADVKGIKQQLESSEQESCSRYNDFKTQKDKKLDQIRESKQQKTEKMKKLKQECEDKKNQYYREQQRKLEQITDQYSLFSTTQFGGVKDCFHYIFILDESDSFRQAYPAAVKGIVSYINSLNATDFVSVIKFASNAQLSFQKKAKVVLNVPSLEKILSIQKGGGTSFLNAFQSLENVLQKSLGNNEFPVIVFITDGQDTTELNETISNIKRQVQDLIFFSIGYGNQIATDQLNSITNQFNETTNLKRQFNNRSIQLYYQNNTPQTLFSDLLSISKNKLSIEEIEEASQQLSKTYNKFSEELVAHYNCLSTQTKKDIEDLSNEEQQLMESNITRQYYSEILQSSKNKFENQKQEKEKELLQQKYHWRTLQEQFNNAVLQFTTKQKSLSNIQNSQQQISVTTQFNPYTLMRNQYHQLQEVYEKKLTDMDTKISELEKTELKAIKEKREEILRLGFSNEIHYANFQKSYNQISKLSILVSNIQTQYIQLIDQMISLGSSFSKIFDFSQDNINKLSENFKNPSEIHIYRSLKQFDNSVNPSNSYESKKKMLNMQDTAILKYCKENGKEDLYDNVIKCVDLKTLSDYLSSPKQKIDNYIKTNIAKNVLKQNSKKERFNKKMQKRKTKLSELQERLEKLEEQLENETEEQKIDSIESKIEVLNSRINNEEEAIYSLEDNLFQVEGQEDQLDEEKIVQKIVYALINAIKDLQHQERYYVSVYPFAMYCERVKQIVKDLQNFRNPEFHG